MCDFSPGDVKSFRDDLWFYIRENNLIPPRTGKLNYFAPSWEGVESEKMVLKWYEGLCRIALELSHKGSLPDHIHARLVFGPRNSYVKEYFDDL
jgi:hypothetical protein